MKKHPFTLLELVVVITIMFIAAGMGIAVIRDKSPSRKLEDASLEWEEFCARVRFQALESGEEREIVFDPANRLFKMRVPEKEETDEPEEEPAYIPGKIEWKIPEDFELGEDYSADGNEDADEDGLLPMFKFYSDGGASGRRRLELRIGELKRSFEVSALTGRVIPVREEEGQAMP
ncbi:MAG: type II secretion system protein [Lentisphaeria bacterium]|nr:type II secretion system protein [Lentisphaeria bacterium]